MRAFSIACFLTMLSAAAAAGQSAPNPPASTVCRPSFTTATGSFSAGTAFVCDYPDAKAQLLVTAQHLFGPMGGLPAAIAWNEMAGNIKKVDASCIDNPASHLISSNVVPIEGAHGVDNNGVRDDIAAFALPGAAGRPALKLATAAPKVGDPVWLYGCQAGGKQVELIHAVVALSTDQELDYSFTNTTIKLHGTSGAPVLDAEGNVVALNIGSTMRRGKLVGYGNPVASIREHLGKALGNK